MKNERGEAMQGSVIEDDREVAKKRKEIRIEIEKEIARMEREGRRQDSKPTRTPEELREMNRTYALRAQFPNKCAGLPRRHRRKTLKLGR
jgi:hypothetical protein